VIASELSSRGGRARSHGTCGNAGAHLVREVRSGAVRHVAVPEPTSVGMCGLKLQLTWQRVDAHPTPCLDLELVCGGTRSSGYRQQWKQVQRHEEDGDTLMRACGLLESLVMQIFANFGWRFRNTIDPP
jgi:hypothetical protein